MINIFGVVDICHGDSRKIFIKLSEWSKQEHLKGGIMKVTAVWLDKREAQVLTAERGEYNRSYFYSNVESHHKATGGKHPRTKFGPQALASQQRYDRRRENYLQKYFKQLMDMLVKSKKILILGPGTAKKALYKLMEENRDFQNKQIDMINADRMEPSEIKQKLEKHFLLKSRNSTM